MSGYSAGGVVPPAGDIGGTILLPRIRSIEAVLVSLLGGATGDVLTQQSDGSFSPSPGGGGGITPPVGDIGGTTGAPIIRSINDVLVTLGGGATGDVLTQQSDGSFEPAAGGGGGLSPLGSCVCGMDSTLYPFAMFLGPQDPSVESEFDLGPWPNPIPGSEGLHYTFASSWVTGTNGGQSVLTLPEFNIPEFHTPSETGMQVLFYIGAWDLTQTYTNLALYEGTLTIADPGGTVQAAVADLIGLEPVGGGDLSLVDGTGFTGNGFVSGGAATAYLCAISGSCDFPGGTIFS